MKILLIIVILHFIVGIGYLAYKLSPRKEDKTDPNNEDKIDPIS